MHDTVSLNKIEEEYYTGTLRSRECTSPSLVSTSLVIVITLCALSWLQHVTNIPHTSQSWPSSSSSFIQLLYTAKREREGASVNMIPGFQRIAPTIWQHSPDATDRFDWKDSDPAKAPTHILLLTWRSARCLSIANYANTYLSLFPAAYFFIITSSVKDIYLQTLPRKQERLKPLLGHLTHYKRNESMQILMHIFFEGGSSQAIELAELYYKETGSRLPVSALCFDSTPSHTHYRRLYNALDRILPPHRISKHAISLIDRIVLGGRWVLVRFSEGHHGSPVSRKRHQLLDPQLFDLSAPRCYLHSTDETLVACQAWQDIRKYIQASIDLDIPVTEVIFITTEHARDMPEQYWGAIKQTWRKAVAKYEHVSVVGQASLTGTSLAEHKDMQALMTWKAESNHTLL